MRRPLLVLGVAVSLAIGSMSYASGSAPEWVVLKSSVGLFTIGMMSWMVCTLTAGISDEPADEIKGARVDVTLAGTEPSGSREDGTVREAPRREVI